MHGIWVREGAFTLEKYAREYKVSVNSDKRLYAFSPFTNLSVIEPFVHTRPF